MDREPLARQAQGRLQHDLQRDRPIARQRVHQGRKRGRRPGRQDPLGGNFAQSPVAVRFARRCSRCLRVAVYANHAPLVGHVKQHGTLPPQRHHVGIDQLLDEHGGCGRIKRIAPLFENVHPRLGRESVLGSDRPPIAQNSPSERTGSLGVGSVTAHGKPPA